MRFLARRQIERGQSRSVFLLPSIDLRSSPALRVIAQSLVNLTRFLRPARPVPAWERRSAILASSSASHEDVGSLVTVWPSIEYETTGEPHDKAVSTLSRMFSNSVNRSADDRAIAACCVGSRVVGILAFQISGTNHRKNHHAANASHQPKVQNMPQASAIRTTRNRYGLRGSVDGCPESWLVASVAVAVHSGLSVFGLRWPVGFLSAHNSFHSKRCLVMRGPQPRIDIRLALFI